MINYILAALILIVIAALISVRIRTFKRLKKSGTNYILIPVSAATCGLCSLVRAYYLEEIFENEKYGRKIILVKMDGSLNTIIANRLAKDYSTVSSVDINKLEDFLKKDGAKNNEETNKNQRKS